MTQKDGVLRHLKRYGKITDVQAFNNYGIRRLGARVWDLRHDGVKIRTQLTTAPNRFGERTTFATYILEK